MKKLMVLVLAAFVLGLASVGCSVIEEREAMRVDHSQEIKMGDIS